MFEFEVPKEVAPEFDAALLSLKQLALRDELEITQLAAPKDIAEHAIALSAELESDTSEVEDLFCFGHQSRRKIGQAIFEWFVLQDRLLKPISVVS